MKNGDALFMYGQYHSVLWPWLPPGAPILMALFAPYRTSFRNNSRHCVEALSHQPGRLEVQRLLLLRGLLPVPPRALGQLAAPGLTRWASAEV